MFRRRPPRRPGGLFRRPPFGPPPPGGPGGPPHVPPLLHHANHMMEIGDFKEAQHAFEELASKAKERFPERAPMLYLQAGRVAILGGNTSQGMAHLRSGLTMLGTQQRYQKVQAFGQRAVDELNARGLIKEAAEIGEVIKANLPANMPAAQESKASKRATLPTHCPSCGAGVNPAEVEWLDDSTAECAYCGSPVRGE